MTIIRGKHTAIIKHFRWVQRTVRELERGMLRDIHRATVQRSDTRYATVGHRQVMADLRVWRIERRMTNPSR